MKPIYPLIVLRPIVAVSQQIQNGVLFTDRNSSNNGAIRLNWSQCAITTETGLPSSKILTQSFHYCNIIEVKTEIERIIFSLNRVFCLISKGQETPSKKLSSYRKKSSKHQIIYYLI